MTSGYRAGGSSSMTIRQQPRRDLEMSVGDENFVLSVVDDMKYILSTSDNNCEVQARMISVFGEPFYYELVEQAVKEIRSRKMRTAPAVGAPIARRRYLNGPSR